MKPLTVLCVGMMVLVTPSLQTRAEVLPSPRFINATVDNSVESLKHALESNSPGLQTSAAQTVRSLKTLFPEQSFTRLVIPLMRIVKDERADTPSRIMSALALHDLHSAIGDYAIAGEARFSDNPRVRHLCNWLAYSQVIEGRREARDGSTLLQILLEQERPEPLPEHVSMIDR